MLFSEHMDFHFFEHHAQNPPPAHGLWLVTAAVSPSDQCLHPSFIVADHRAMLKSITEKEHNNRGKPKYCF